MDKTAKKMFFSKMVDYFFETIFIIFLLLFFMEYVKTGVVSNSLSYNAILTLTLFLCIMAIFFGSNIEERQHSGFMAILRGALVSSVIAFLIYVVINYAFKIAHVSGTMETIFAVIPWVISAGIFCSVMIILKHE